MATTPHSEHGKTGTQVAEHGGHPVDKPEQWGWHGEMGRSSRVGGWVSLVILLLMILPAHYNGQGTLFLSLTAAALFVVLVWDRQRRKNAWRQ